MDKKRNTVHDKTERMGVRKVSKAQSEKEREWTVRKQKQKPHGKVKTKKELTEE